MYKELLTIKDMKNKFKVQASTIYEWMKKGMPSVKINGARRFEEDKVMEWVNQRNELPGDSSAQVGGDSEKQ